MNTTNIPTTNLISKITNDYFPDIQQVSLIRSINDDNDLLFLSNIIWHPKYSRRSNLSFVLQTSNELIEKIIEDYDNNIYINSIASYRPAIIKPSAYANRKNDMTTLVFSPPQNQLYPELINARLLSEYLSIAETRIDIFTEELVKLLEGITKLKEENTKRSSTLRLKDLINFVPNFLDNLKYYPTPISTEMLDYGFYKQPSTINAAKLIINSKDDFEALLGFTNNQIGLNRIITTTPPIILNWDKTLNLAPITIEYAKLELEILIKLIPPTNQKLWYGEWPAIINELINFDLETKKIPGRLAPSVLDIIRIIRNHARRMIGSNDLNNYWISAVIAGMTTATSPTTYGANRLAASLYANKSMEQLFINKVKNIQTTTSTPVFWPGHNAWKKTSVHKTNDLQGNLLLVGAGKFPKDGNIDQLPQVRADLYALADFFSSMNYGVYTLIDQDFTSDQFHSVTDHINRNLNTLPLIIIFCGHGVYIDDEYYLLTGNATLNKIKSTSFSFVDFFNNTISANNKNSMVIINSCYSGQSISEALKLENYRSYRSVILTSTQSGEKSYMLRDNPLSIFVEAFLEALSINIEKKGYADLFSCIDYICKSVPQKAARISQEQHPSFILNGISDNFRIIQTSLDTQSPNK